MLLPSRGFRSRASKQRVSLRETAASQRLRNRSASRDNSTTYIALHLAPRSSAAGLYVVHSSGEGLFEAGNREQFQGCSVKFPGADEGEEFAGDAKLRIGQLVDYPLRLAFQLQCAHRLSP